MHDQSADEQLTNLQKRIFLIEFLRLGLFIVYQEKSYLIQLVIITPPEIFPSIGGVFLFIKTGRVPPLSQHKVTSMYNEVIK